MRLGITGIPSQSNKRLVADGYQTFEIYNNRQMTKQELADSIGIGITGSLNQKIGDLKKIGILRGQENSFRLTELAINLYTNKDPALLISSFKQVPFYRYLLEKYVNTPITYEIIRKELTEYAKLKPDEANSLAEKVYKLFHESEEFVSSKPNLDEFFISVKEEKKLKLSCMKESTSTVPNQSISPIQTENQTEIPLLTPSVISSRQITVNGNGDKKSMEKKFELTILFRDEKIAVTDEESFRFAEYLLKKIGRELGVESDN
jgi:hypothetical protein